MPRRHHSSDKDFRSKSCACIQISFGTKPFSSLLLQQFTVFDIRQGISWASTLTINIPAKKEPIRGRTKSHFSVFSSPIKIIHCRCCCRPYLAPVVHTPEYIFVFVSKSGLRTSPYSLVPWCLPVVGFLLRLICRKGRGPVKPSQTSHDVNNYRSASGKVKTVLVSI